MLTKREAIRECKRLWKQIEKSGRSKVNFLFSNHGWVWKQKYLSSAFCPLCRYVKDRTGNFGLVEKSNPGIECKEFCPLVLQYQKSCVQLGYDSAKPPSPEWLNAIKGLKE